MQIKEKISTYSKEPRATNAYFEIEIGQTQFSGLKRKIFVPPKSLKLNCKRKFGKSYSNLSYRRNMKNVRCRKFKLYFLYRNRESLRNIFLCHCGFSFFFFLFISVRNNFRGLKNYNFSFTIFILAIFELYG